MAVVDLCTLPLKKLISALRVSAAIAEKNLIQKKVCGNHTTVGSKKYNIPKNFYQTSYIFTCLFRGQIQALFQKKEFFQLNRVIGRPPEYLLDFNLYPLYIADINQNVCMALLRQ